MESDKFLNTVVAPDSPRMYVRWMGPGVGGWTVDDTQILLDSGGLFARKVNDIRLRTALDRVLFPGQN